MQVYTYKIKKDYYIINIEEYKDPLIDYATQLMQNGSKATALEVCGEVSLLEQQRDLEAVKGFVKLQDFSVLRVATQHSYIYKLINQSVCKGVSYVILLKFKVKAGSNRNYYLKGLTCQCSGVGLLSSNVTLLITTNN